MSKDLQVGDSVKVRMLGLDVTSTINAIRLARWNRREFQVAIPDGLELRLKDSDERDGAYIRRSRIEGGFWYYATAIERGEQ